ncbi:pantoate--beta-alanine ligase [Uliginosibacterium paludis]|uniref:Pantothenate synthetase n=1 Tax=Uliginosibacterium paludis TaxID=1615952 RepID=A0ABV2CPG5_9RHOO
MQIHTTIRSLQAALADSGRIAFAPTMGNLHAGHISLMRNAQAHADTIVSSIFVNRIQFGPNEDFDRYPRTFQADCEKLEANGVHHVFAPDEQELYPSPQQYFVRPANAHDSILEGAVRPGHFQGVTTIVNKLFNIVGPDVALFGKKDYQQLMIIRNMVRELNMPIEIIGCETVRAEDGLALSSRNGYLSPAERAEAPRLAAVLRTVADAVLAGGSNYEALESRARQTLEEHGWQPDYVAIRNRSDLQAPRESETLVVLAAARLGATRLLDNLEIG